MKPKLVAKRANGDVLTTTNIIAKAIGHQHKDVMVVVNNNEDILKKFGEIARRDQPIDPDVDGVTVPTKVAFLNEQQAMITLSFLPKSKKARDFQIELTSAFQNERAAPIVDSFATPTVTAAAPSDSSVTVAGVTTSVITYRDQPVCTTKQLADFYGCEDVNVTNNFQRNNDKFEEGKHFFKLEGTELKEFQSLPSNRCLPSKYATSYILWTEKGAARHAKMLTTEKAWEVFEQLEDCYFRTKEAHVGGTAPVVAPGPVGVTAAPLTGAALAREILDCTKLGKEVAEFFGLSGNHALIYSDKFTQASTGYSPMKMGGITHLLANPLGQTYTPTELGKMQDPPISGNAMNKLLELNGLQIGRKHGKATKWEPTEKASGKYEWLDTGKAHAVGTPIKQLKWFKTILDDIHMTKKAA